MYTRMQWAILEAMSKAPAFSLADQNGVTHTLADYDGRWIILYFYPKDNTPGCTTQACEFRDEHTIISQFGNAAIIGVNKDSVASHKLFARLHRLNFPILSDPDHTTIQAYGAWKSKKILGKTVWSTARVTHIISPTGEIVKTYKNVVPKGHAAQIIEDLQSLQDA